MSLKHKSVHQINGEYICTHCGKSWDTNDVDPPECIQSPLQASAEQFVELAKQYEAGPITREEVSRSIRAFGLDANVAWLVTQGGPKGGTATVVYAPSRADARKYVDRLIGAHPCVDLYRLRALDESAVGATPYFELNPEKLKRAAKAQRCVVTSFHRFKEYVR